MEVIKNLLNSEKAVTMGLLVVCATVLAGLGKISWGDWQSYTQGISALYIGGKTIQGAVAAVAASRANTNGIGTSPSVQVKVEQNAAPEEK